MLGIVQDFSTLTRVVAPDTPGNGDSTALPLDTVQITDLARGLLNFLDAMGLKRVQLYGSHTGAAIATEIAILDPARVDRLVLDGVQVLTPEEREEVMSKYAFPFTPDLEGSYLMRVFQFCRDQYLFYPWYNRTKAGQRTGGLPKPHDLHNWVVEVLKASETYHLNYRAAFQWKAPERLPLVSCPTLVLAAENDPLINETRDVAPVLKDGRYIELPRFDAPDYAALRKSAIAGFLGLAG